MHVYMHEREGGNGRWREAGREGASEGGSLSGTDSIHSKLELINQYTACVHVCVSLYARACARMCVFCSRKTS